MCIRDSLDLFVREDPVEPGLLDVEDLAADGEDRLGTGIAAALRGATGRVALDDEHLALGRVVRLAVRELARQASAAEESLAATGDVAGLASCDPCGRRGLRLADDVLALSRVLLEPVAELVVDDPLHE